MKKTVRTKTIKVEVKTTSCVFDEKETKVLVDCLNYCYHRAFKHQTPVSFMARDINKLREDFGIITLAL